MNSRAAGIGLASAVLLAGALAPACTQGEGTGSVCGSLDVPNCWAGPFNLHPNFFAAVPTQPSDSLQIRIQNGANYQTFSDGIEILIDDIAEIRGGTTSTGAASPSLLGQTLIVGLPAGVTPPGVPLSATANPTIVHASLYLDNTCRTQNDALYAVSAVTLNPDGTCLSPDGGEPQIVCPGPAVAGAEAGTDAGAPDAGAPAPGAIAPDASTLSVEAGAAAESDVASCPDNPESAADGEAASLISIPGTSTIVFSSLFDGNEDESNAQERLTDAQFDFYLADPREICPGGIGPPPPCRGHLVGYFRFYFELGTPAQPFP